MKKILFVSLLISIIVVSSSAWGSKGKTPDDASGVTLAGKKKSQELVVTQEEAEQPGYERGVLIVKFMPPTARSLLSKLNGRGEIDSASLLPPSFQAFAGKYRFSSIKPLFNPALVSPEHFNRLRDRFSLRAQRGASPELAPRLDHIFKIMLDRQADLEQAARELRANLQVIYAEPNRPCRAFFVPNDQYYNSNDLWGLFKVQASSAWDTATGQNVTVAVIDTGVDLLHADLQANMWVNTDEVASNNIDDDNNGYVDDRAGWDFAYDDNLPTDLNGHGTHVGGTIGAVGNNLNGVVGLAFQSKLMAVKGLNDNGNGLTTDLAEAMLYAVNNGADVINNSWGGGNTQLIVDMVDAAHAMGVVTVSAAGNDTTEACNFCPASAENSLTVSALKVDDSRSSFSNFGVKVDVGAPGGQGGSPATLTPGTDILSTSPLTSVLATSGYPVLTGGDNRKYMPLAGTSMAAPHVSALAALLIQSHPAWNNEEIRQAIRRTTNDVSAPGFDTDSGYGRINAANAVSFGTTPPAVALLYEPHNCKNVSGVVSVMGRASVAAGPSSYVVQVGAGDTPASFVSIGGSNTPVLNGLLTNFNTLNFPDGRQTVRVTTTDIAAGTSSEDRNVVNVNNVFIVTPVEHQVVTNSSQLVTGMAAGNLGFVNYKLEWAVGCNATTGFNLITNSVTQVNPVGTLANWNLNSVPDGQVTLRLTATFSGNGGFISQDQRCVIVDKLLAPGWPVPINHVLTFKSPKIADLDDDGANEIVVGASVFQANGSVRPGWTNFPGLGRTNPAILNLDATRETLEVVAAVFDGMSSSPNNGAPVIYAYRHDKFVVWSYEVQNPNATTGGFNDGTPSAISAGDVDGDGQPEIVFTMFFNNFNNPLQTWVFVLDAATGAVQTSFPVDGITQSSVALADVDENGVTDLTVISWIPATSAGLVSVLNGSGTAVAGWPVQIPSAADVAGFGNIDPVLADVDVDGHLDILAGKHLLSYNGTPKTGWPIPFISRSTGAMLPLSNSDCAMEVLSGGGNSVVFWGLEHTGGLSFLKLNTFENLFVILLGENGLQANPVIADIDGDQQVEILRPSELGSTVTDKAMPLYGSEAGSSSSPVSFPRFVLTTTSAGWSDLIRSTPAVGDVDKDGDVDLVLAAGGKLYLWNLNQPYTPALSYWPMFQHDLRNTGLAPSSLVGDLYMKDSPTDVGNEPNSNNTLSDIWISPDIWNCRTNQNCTTHQNPEYHTSANNYMRVRVNNRGCAPSPPAKLRMYWTRARTNETWDMDWVNSGGGTTAQPLGNEITSGSGLTIPSIPAGGSVVLTHPWQPPNPSWNGYQLTGVDWQGYPMVCLLARIESANDPMLNEDFGPLTPNVFNNNNVVTRNTYVTDLTPGNPFSQYVTVMVRNPRAVAEQVTLTLAPPTPVPPLPFQNYGVLTLTLEEGIWLSWAAGGFRGRGFEISGNREIRVVDPTGAQLEGILLNPGASGQVAVRFRLLATSPAIDGRNFRFLLTQSHGQPSQNLQLDGVVAFEINTKRARTGGVLDFDGDAKSDISVFRPSNATWYLNQSTSGFTAFQFGLSSDKIVPADYDGDGKTDVAVFRNGVWYQLRSSAGFAGVQFGQAGDIPVPGDYDADGKSDTCIYRPSAGTFYLLRSAGGALVGQQWGVSGDQPVAGDYDGDGKTDFAVFRPSTSTFYILRSSNGSFFGYQWGTGGDKPVVGDFDGDGKTDIAVFRPSAGAWYYLQSSDNSFKSVAWGTSGDIPSAGDYDGDGKWDVTVFRPSSNIFYILQSTNNALRAEQFGANGDVPVASAYVP